MKVRKRKESKQILGFFRLRKLGGWWGHFTVIDERGGAGLVGELRDLFGPLKVRCPSDIHMEK